MANCIIDGYARLITKTLVIKDFDVTGYREGLHFGFMKSKPDLFIQFVTGISSTVFSFLCSFVSVCRCFVS